MKHGIGRYVEEQVVSIEHLRQLARSGRSCYSSMGRLPAVVFLNMQASFLLKMIDSGRLFIYPKFVGGNVKVFRTRRRKRKCDLPEWCTPGKIVFWSRSKQNHVITSISKGKIYFTPGNDYPGWREWCSFDRVYQLQPVELIDEKQNGVHNG